MASAIALRLHKANMRRVLMIDLCSPLAVRREVSFSTSILQGKQEIDSVFAQHVEQLEDIFLTWEKSGISVITDVLWSAIRARFSCDIFIDATLAKKNLGTTQKDAPLVIALGPGFIAGKEVHLVIETHRGHNLGQIITSGSAEVNTGIPGNIAGYTTERVIRAPMSGTFTSQHQIGDLVRCGDIIGKVDDSPITSAIDGVLRGLIQSQIWVKKGIKLGDVDPRADVNYCYTISDKARTISGSVLEAILSVFNAPKM